MSSVSLLFHMQNFLISQFSGESIELLRETARLETSSVRKGIGAFSKRLHITLRSALQGG